MASNYGATPQIPIGLHIITDVGGRKITFNKTLGNLHFAIYIAPQLFSKANIIWIITLI